MTNLDLYAKCEHLLGIEEATETLHALYLGELEEYAPKTVLDIGCGRGGFMELLLQEDVAVCGCDLSRAMADTCKEKNLNVIHGSISDVSGKFDAIVAIFDVLNFLDSNELDVFLSEVALHLEDGGIFIADINTKHGFSNVADGVMSSEDENFFLNVDAAFVNDRLTTSFTLFEKTANGCYRKYQDDIKQYFHPIRSFQKHPLMKLTAKQTFSLYDTKDKTLLIMKHSASKVS